MGYRVSYKDVPEVMVNLNKRESGGYVTKTLTMHTRANPNSCSIAVLVYIATEDNSNYLGPASVEEIAKQVVRSTGESGPNTEYVLKLAEWMRSAVPSADDKHLFDIEAEILKITSKK